MSVRQAMLMKGFWLLRILVDNLICSLSPPMLSYILVVLRGLEFGTAHIRGALVMQAQPG